MSNRKILHAADIHLDSPLQKLDAYENAPVEQIRGASRRALENLVGLAIDQQVDLVVIAGDLYDGDWNDLNTGLFFGGQASRLVQAGIPLVVIRGNHDAANVMTASLPLPSNPDGSDVMMSADEVDLRSFESIGIAVHGRSFRSRAETENMAQRYPAPLSGLFNLGLLHTSLTGAEGHDPYAPCTPAELSDKGYDYWALGHVHTRGHFGLEGAAPIVFSGNIQGRHIRETGPKGCEIIEIDPRGNCQQSFYPLDVVRWERCQIDVASMGHVDEVMDAYQKWLSESLAGVEQRLLVARVELSGESSLHGELHRAQDHLTAALRAMTVSHGGHQAWLEAVRVRTRMPVDAIPVDVDGPLKSLASVVDELRTGDGLEEIIRGELQALTRKLPPEAGQGTQAMPIDDSQWCRQLLESASANIVDRLRQQEASS